ncbi:MAG: hypothetical protein KA712_05980 [Myxococcales bacterium]|nr:hypothetical protein [Myxococcales bacterium]
MADVLASLSPQQVAGFYGRLANSVDARKGKLEVSLAAMLMRLWLENRKKGDVLTIDAPAHLRGHEQTKSTLEYHRRVFLTQDQARLGSKSAWAGNDADRDLLYSLHGFQLHSSVTLAGVDLPLHPVTKKSPGVRVSFQSFMTYAWDIYDWDYSEHLTVPNPDYGSRSPDAVAPKSETVVVYHKHAKRIEDAGLAAPYKFQTRPWRVLDAGLVAPADVDPSRNLR